MRWILIIYVLLTTGCSASTYKSELSALVVSECIADKWANAGASERYKVPIAVEKQEDGYFVAFSLQRLFFSPIIFGLKHPTYSVWAKVTETANGSTTEYHRAFQIWHARIDRAVQDCQVAKSQPGR